MQRVEKLLEDAQIKLSSVISDIFAVSGRQMLEALIAGQRNPSVLAQMAHSGVDPSVRVVRIEAGRVEVGAFRNAQPPQHGFRGGPGRPGCR